MWWLNIKLVNLIPVRLACSAFAVCHPPGSVTVRRVTSSGWLSNGLCCCPGSAAVGGEGPLLRGTWGAAAPQCSSGPLHRGYSHSSPLRVRNVSPAHLSLPASLVGAEA